MLPVIPYLYYFASSRSFGSPIAIEKMESIKVFILLFCVLIIIFILENRRYSALENSEIKKVYIGYSILSYMPFLISGAWFFSSPFIHKGNLNLFMLGSLIPLLFNFAWHILPIKLYTKLKWNETFFLPTLSILSTLIFIEVGSHYFLDRNAFGKNMSVNNSDRSYWYFKRKLDVRGINIASSYGFIGPDPDFDHNGLTILLIGDSIPAAGRSINYPNLAQSLLGKNLEYIEPVQIINASIAGFSLEQLKRFYIEKLADIPHDILLLNFYIDDINRELRYRKNNYLYTPSWPEWMQDIYYRSFLCQSFLNLFGFNQNTMLHYRTKTYQGSLPDSLHILNDLLYFSRSRGVKMAIYNIPRFIWKDILIDRREYKYLDLHQKIETWANQNSVDYYDALSALIGKDIRTLRISDSDIHFNDKGHQLMAHDLMKFIKILTLKTIK